MGATIEDKDLGFGRLMEASDAIAGTAVKIGVTGEGGRPSAQFVARKYGEAEPSEPTDFTVSQVASWHEFGQGVPERSFLRSYTDGEGRKELGDAARGATEGVLADAVPLDSLVKFPGNAGVRGMKAKITSRIPPALSEITTSDPGRDSAAIPLYDTRQIFESIRFAED